MKKKYRRIYAFTLVFVFFLIAPVLVFYASGFRYDFSNRKIIKTGVLSIESEPRNAQVKINGKLSGAKTPTVVKNLFPGDYTISVEKQGYYTWEKVLPVFANQSTTTNRVSLLKSEATALAMEETVTGIVYSPANRYLSYLTSNEDDSSDLVVKEHNTLATVITIKNIGSDSQIAFSGNENFVFIKNKSNDVIARIISLPDKLDILSKSISDLPIYKLVESGDLRELYAISENGLFKINIVDKTIDLIIKGQIQDVIELDQSIYYIEKQNDLSVLSKIDKNDLITTNEILTLSNNGIYSLSKFADSYINLHDTKNQELSLIRVQDQFSFNLKKLNPDVSSFTWSPDNSTLMLFNDFEIWVFDPESDQQELLIRSGSAIRFADWSPDGKWIIYSNEGFIKAIELDGRGKRNIINLAESDFAPFSVNKNTKVMLYHDASQHLYRKSIQ